MSDITASSFPAIIQAFKLLDGSQPLFRKDFNAILNMLEALGPFAIFDTYVINITQGYDSATSGTLAIGTTYLIKDYNAGDDFTNVGAASNASGVQFVATGTTPAVWDNSSELWSSFIPTAEEAYNGIGTIELSYNDTGSYYLTSDGAFTNGKTIVQTAVTGKPVTDSISIIGATVLNVNVIEINTYSFNIVSGEWELADQLLNNSTIEVRVYR